MMQGDLIGRGFANVGRADMRWLWKEALLAGKNGKG